MKSEDFVEFTHWRDTNHKICIKKDQIIAFCSSPDKDVGSSIVLGDSCYYEVRESYEECKEKIFGLKTENPSITLKYDEDMREYIDKWIQKWSTQGATPLKEDWWQRTDY